jgi:hypothetical protein
VIAWLAWLGTAATALFAGAALYVTLVEHPARRACGPMMAVAEFRRSYPRGAALQAPLAVVGALGAAGVGLAGGSVTWLVAGVLVGLAVPFTLVVIMPTNQRLLDQTMEPDTPEAERLLRRWGLLHLVRTLLGLVALGLMLGLLARR